VLDEAVLAQLVCDLGPEPVVEVCRLFLENATAGVDAVRLALASGDTDGAARSAHRLKSSSGFFGATRLAALCAEVEGRAHADDLAGRLVRDLQRTSVDMSLAVRRLAGHRPPAG
jgi:HPt (histidine-containing phosphotransfer) domain-containing protein